MAGANKSGKRGRKADPVRKAANSRAAGYRETALAVPMLADFREEVSDLTARIARFERLDDTIAKLEAKLASARGDKSRGVEPIQKRLEALASVSKFVAERITPDNSQSHATSYAERIGTEAASIYLKLGPSPVADGNVTDDDEEAEEEELDG